MTISTITPLPTAPSRDDAPATFISRANAFLAAMVTMGTELNTSIGQMNTDIAGVNQDAQDAADSAASAIASANFKGAWSSLTGALNIPASVSHSGSIWILLNNLADVTASEPGVSADWQDLPIIPSQTGQSGKYLTTDGSSTSWGELTVSAGEKTFVATGSITAGQTVGLKTDGTVEIISGTAAAQIYNESAYQEYSITTTNIYDFNFAYDSVNQKVYALYAQTADLYVRIGTVSGDQISFGSDVLVTNAKYANQWMDFAVNYDPDQDRMVVFYQNSSNLLTAVAGVVVGSTVTFGSPASLATYNFQESRGFSFFYDTEHNTHHVAFESSTQGNAALAPFTVSGTTITWGNFFRPNSGHGVNGASGDFCPSINKIIVGAFGTSTTHYFYLVDFDGTDYTLEATETFTSTGAATAEHTQLYYDDDTATAVMAAYHDGENKGVAATVTSSTITAGTIINLANSTSQNYGRLAYNPNANHWWYGTSGNDVFELRKITVSGTTITSVDAGFFSGTLSPDGNYARMINIFTDTTTGMNFAFLTHQGFNEWLSRGWLEGQWNTNADTFVGIAKQTVTDGQNVTVTITAGTNENVTGLSTGVDYWVNYNGDLVNFATSFSKVGRALSATKILVSGSSDSPLEDEHTSFFQAGQNMTAGDMVYLDSSGVLGPASYSRGDFDTNVAEANDSTNFYSASWGATCYVSPNSSRVLYVWWGSNQYLYGRLGEYDKATGSLTFTTTPSVLESTVGKLQTTQGGIKIVYNTTNSCWYVLYFNSSQYLRGRSVKDQATLSTAVATLYSGTVHDSSNGGMNVSYDRTNNQGLATWRYDSSSMLSRSFKANGNGAPSTPGMGSSYLSGISGFPTSNWNVVSWYDDVNLVHRAMYPHQSANVRIFAYDLINTPTVTPLPSTNGFQTNIITNSASGQILGAWCKTPSRIALFYRDTSNNNQSRLIEVTGASTYDLGTSGSTQLTQNASTWIQYSFAWWSEALQKLYFTNSNIIWQYSLNTATSNGVTDDPVYFDVWNNWGNTYLEASWDDETGCFMGGVCISSNYYMKVYFMDELAGSWIGAVDYSVTTPSKTSVSTVGDVNNNQTGLIAGSKYEPSGNTLKASSTGRMTAVSSTELFIRSL